MSFSSGPISFRRFQVLGQHPQAVDLAMLNKISEHALRPDSTAPAVDVEYGFSGGRHVLDGKFTFEHNVFADALHLGLRIDSNRVPGELKKAYRLLEEEAAAAANPSGFLSKKQRHDSREVVRRKLDEDLRSGRFRRSRLLPMLWDFPAGALYCSADGSAADQLAELFDRALGLELKPLSAGSLAMRVLEDRGRRRDYEDLHPTRFVPGPEGENQTPDYPWLVKGPTVKDFLGNEFLLWLWHETDLHGGAIATHAGEVTILLDRRLDLACAYGHSGKDLLLGDGPTAMPEARDALRSGKLPRRCGMILDAAGLQSAFTFHPERMALTALKLPDVPEADSPRVLFEERIALLRDLCKSIDALFDTFLKLRTGGEWEGTVTAIRRWIFRGVGAPGIAAVA